MQICHTVLIILFQSTKENCHMKFNQFEHKFFSSFLCTLVACQVFVLDKDYYFFLSLNVAFSIRRPPQKVKIVGYT